MPSISELCSKEFNYVEKLKFMVNILRNSIAKADDAELHTDVGLLEFPGLMKQHRDMLKFYEAILEVHEDLLDFWTHTEDYLWSADLCGQLYYRALNEHRFDVYLRHIVGNPMRGRAVQRDFKGYLVSEVK